MRKSRLSLTIGADFFILGLNKTKKFRLNVLIYRCMQWIFVAIIAIILIGVLRVNIPTQPTQEEEGVTLLPTNDGQAEMTDSANSAVNPMSIDLSGQQLDKVPDYVFKQSNLVHLNLSNNHFTGALQAEVRHLSNLESLDLSNNQFTGVPAEIGQLTKLKVLDLSNNQLTGLPHELGNLKNLKTLDLRGNNPSEFDLNVIRSSLPATVQILLD